MEPIESTYQVDIDDFIKKFATVSDTYDKIIEKEKALGGNRFQAMTNDVANFNRKLADGVSIYQSIEADAKSYRAEIKRLTDIEKALIKAQAEFKDSAKFDTVQKDLQVTRERLLQVKEAFRLLNKEGEENKRKTKEITGGLFNLRGVALKVAGAVAAVFTVNKAIEVGKSIVEATSSYEKYFAVLRNGFRDEQRASESLQLIYKFAKDTPYQINEITEAYVRLVNRGFTPTEKELIKIGDFASTNAKSITQWVEAIADAETNQYERLREFGISFQTVGDKVTFTFRGIAKTVEKNNVGAIRQALLSFGELNGVVGAMSARALTLEGRISNLQDSLEQLFASIGTGNSGVLTEFVSLMQQAVEWTANYFKVPLSQKYREEQVEINALVQSLIKFRDNAILRNATYTELIQKYPSVIALIGREITTTEHLQFVLSQVNTEYERKIRLAGLQEALTEKTKEQAKLQLEILKQEKLIQKTVEDRLKKQGNGRLLSLYQDPKTSANVKANIEKSVGVNVTNLRGTDEDLGTRLQTVKDYNEALKNRTSLNEQLMDSTSDMMILQRKVNEQQGQEIENLREFRRQNDLKISQLKAKGKLNKEEIATLKALENANKAYLEKEQRALGTFKEPTPAKIQTAGEISKAEKERKALLKEHEKLLELQRGFEEEMQKLQIDSNNVRLQMLDKNSKDYLELKRSYDLKELDEEVRKYEKLFDIQSGKAIKDAGTGDVRIQSFTEGRINALRAGGISEADAKKQADLELSALFANSQKTIEVRKLMRLKAELIDKNYFQDLADLQLESEQTLADLLGDGTEKQLQEIDLRYKRQREKYKDNEAILNQYFVKAQQERQKVLLDASNQRLDQRTESRRNFIENDPQRSGELNSDFEQRKRKALLDLDREYYSEKLKLLKKYLESEQYLIAVSSGVISTEQNEENQNRLNELEKAIAKVDREAAKSQITTAKYADNWEVVGDIFDALTGKALKFSEDAGLDKFVKESLTNAINIAKQGLSELLSMELDASNKRLETLEKSISDREKIVSEEYDRYKQGLSNNYLFEKDMLKKVQDERAKELENKKKIQKQQAVIDSLSIASANLVATANMIVSASAAIADGAKLGLVGVALGIAAAVALVGTFISIKARFKQAQQLRKGTKFGGKRLEGPAHEEGGLKILDENGNVQYEAEGDEWLIGSKASKKHNKLLEHINEDSFKKLSHEEQKALLRPLGLKMHESSFSSLQRDASSRRAWNEAREQRQLKEAQKQSLYLKYLSERENGLSWVSVGGGKVVALDSKGKILKTLQLEWKN